MELKGFYLSCEQNGLQLTTKCDGMYNIGMGYMGILRTRNARVQQIFCFESLGKSTSGPQPLCVGGMRKRSLEMHVAHALNKEI